MNQRTEFHQIRQSTTELLQEKNL